VTATQAPAYPALGVAAKGIVRREDGAILIIRRSLGSTTDPGFWDLPGGKMDRGERLTDALAREVLEETGLVVEPLRPFHVTHFVKEPFWVTSVTFLCSLAGGEVRLSPEHIEYAWVAPDDLANRSYSRAIREQLEAFSTLIEGEPPA
jgi:8-oxo-dGTP diphosphatase